MRKNPKYIRFENDRVIERIKYGDEQVWLEPGMNKDDDGYDECGDCGVKLGEYHLLGCDIEECPNCGGQALGCFCEGEKSYRKRFHYKGSTTERMNNLERENEELRNLLSIQGTSN